ncbi:peptidoglycan DD-metalloendopeptidase family protein [Pontibacter sp. SGAir0037]|uniref:peptidoglycan DD-metalloendopeptidase family protein n=1 Tax=Pontibacter sp. SGAir0037 TaxID=2571030 RepID=UPI0010CD2C00|nr:peptidoglycan DD-metalloendopeptidase family protein [Pontibacter sp. SGAir0037]QCR22943.1 peptidase M23 [Pontibacter sp. SGAir0037]
MMKRSIGFVVLVALWLGIIITGAQTLEFIPSSTVEENNSPQPRPAAAIVKKPAPVLYGIATDSLEIVEGVVERGETLSEILGAYNISPTVVANLVDKARNIFNVRKISADRNYTILHALDSAQTAQYFIYEPSQEEYVIYDLRGELNVLLEKRKVDTVERVISGEIRNSLYMDLVAAGGSPQLVNRFADIYAWRINLNHLQPGDKFKLIYDERVLDGNTIGFGNLKAAYFEQNGKPIYAIRFNEGNNTGYFDQDGKSLKKAFLREPLEFSRISSRYTMNRFHPVQKINKPHLGTDFAAPRGTPIRTVGDGVVLEATFTRGNGYYVKVKHNSTYTTQYLHMSKFAKGIKKGARVQQGQTIGYVGSTGLATGPHLCYRFWKNGKQVDGLKVNLPSANPVEKKYMPAFTALKEEVMQKMETIPVNTTPSDLIATDKEVTSKDA